MDNFPIIQYSIQISADSSLLMSSWLALAVFIFIPYVFWRPVYWLLSLIGLSLKELLPGRSHYLYCYLSHVAPETSRSTYKLPLWPSTLHGLTQPPSIQKWLLDPLGALMFYLPFKTRLPWIDERLLQNKLEPLEDRDQGIKIRRYVFRRSIRLDFYFRERTKDTISAWQHKSASIKHQKYVDIFFNSRYRLILRVA